MNEMFSFVSHVRKKSSGPLNVTFHVSFRKKRAPKGKRASGSQKSKRSPKRGRLLAAMEERVGVA